MTIRDFRSRFGFHATPFTPELPVPQQFVHQNRDQALELLLRAVDKRMSAALVAPAGTGKTALLRALVERLPEIRYRVHYVKVTDLTKRDLCREIAAAMGVEPAGAYPVLARRIQDLFAENLDTDGLRPVLILDEAHDFRPDVLGILRILTNFDMDSRLVVSIVLAGQPPLEKLLRQHKLQDLTQRLAACTTLPPLSREQTTAYVNHRCTTAGAKACPFDPQAIEALFEVGRGNMRATDYLALNALELAHHANADVVDSNHVVLARRNLWT